MISQLQPITVTQLNRYTRALLEENHNLRDAFVVGEISNFRALSGLSHGSGHWYLTLKDECAAVAAVMFRESNKRLVFLPQNGMRVLVRGHVSLYERDGKFQLYIDDMQPDGLGALQMAFEQLKARLEAEGLFDPERKRPLPTFPRRIGVVTSETGAVLQDIRRILGRRYPVAEVIVCPVPVQGPEAAKRIAAAVKLLNKEQAVDVIIVGRGGGSMEDLWAFNEEITARAVAGSQIPVISAVGHETDFTICDFAADLRAPTPSAAAELATPELRVVLANLTGRQRYIYSTVFRRIKICQDRLDALMRRRVMRRPKELVFASRQRLDAAQQRIWGATQAHIDAKKGELTRIETKLAAIDPMKVLSRGYAMALKQGKPATRVSQLSPGDVLELRLRDGACQVVVWGIQ